MDNDATFARTDQRAEFLAMAAVCGGGLWLLVWSWQTTGSLIVALIVTVMGGLFLLAFLGPIVAVLAFATFLVIDFIRWSVRRAIRVRTQRNSRDSL